MSNQHSSGGGGASESQKKRQVARLTASRRRQHYVNAGATRRALVGADLRRDSRTRPGAAGKSAQPARRAHRHRPPVLLNPQRRAGSLRQGLSPIAGASCAPHQKSTAAAPLGRLDAASREHAHTPAWIPLPHGPRSPSHRPSELPSRRHVSTRCASGDGSPTCHGPRTWTFQRDGL